MCACACVGVRSWLVCDGGKHRKPYLPRQRYLLYQVRVVLRYLVDRYILPCCEPLWFFEFCWIYCRFVSSQRRGLGALHTKCRTISLLLNSVLSDAFVVERNYKSVPWNVHAFDRIEMSSSRTVRLYLFTARYLFNTDLFFRAVFRSVLTKEIRVNDMSIKGFMLVWCSVGMQISWPAIIAQPTWVYW